MSKKKFTLGLIFASISFTLTLFTIVNAFIPGTASGNFSDFFGNIIKFVINDNNEIDPTEVKAESITLSLDNRYKYNYVEGYSENEMAFGSTKKLIAEILPKDTTETNITFTSSDENVHLNQDNLGVFIEANTYSESFTITASIKDTHIKKDYTFYVKPLVAPLDFDIEVEDEIKNNLTSIIKVTPKSSIEDINDPLKYCRYFDSSKLTYISSNTSIATVDSNGVIIGKSVGTTNITVTNGTISKTKTINVISNTSPIVYPDDNWTISSSINKAYIGDMNFDGVNDEVHNTALTIDWGSNVPSDTKVLYESDNPLAAMVDPSGIVRGYRTTGVANIKVTPTIDPSKSKTIQINVEDVLISSLHYVNEKSSISIEKGATTLISPSYLPLNANEKKLDGEASDPSIVEVESRGSKVAVKGLENGKTKIKIYAVNNPEASIDYEIEVTPLRPINSSNEDDFMMLMRKSIGHLLLFMANAIFTTLGAILLLSDKKEAKYKYGLYVVSLLYGFVIAGISELIQIGIPGRSGRWKDVGINTLGYAIGLLLVIITMLSIYLIRKIIAKKKQKQTK